jgi:hypothetical protein
VNQNQPIPVIISSPRNPHRTQCIPTRVLRKVDKNEKVKESAAMPVLAVANCRSIEPKLKSVIEKIENEQIDCMMFVEYWEKIGKNINILRTK